MSRLHQLVDQFFAETVDIQSPLGNKMLQPAFDLGGAGEVLAAGNHFARGTVGFMVTDGTVFRQFKRDGSGWALFPDDFHHFRNNIACPLD